MQLSDGLPFVKVDCSLINVQFSLNTPYSANYENVYNGTYIGGGEGRGVQVEHYWMSERGGRWLMAQNIMAGKLIAIGSLCRCNTGGNSRYSVEDAAVLKGVGENWRLLLYSSWKYATEWGLTAPTEKFAAFLSELCLDKLAISIVDSGISSFLIAYSLSWRHSTDPPIEGASLFLFSAGGTFIFVPKWVHIGWPWSCQLIAEKINCILDSVISCSKWKQVVSTAVRRLTHLRSNSHDDVSIFVDIADVLSHDLVSADSAHWRCSTTLVKVGRPSQ